MNTLTPAELRRIADRMEQQERHVSAQALRDLADKKEAEHGE
jgi:hypothetical protein